MRGIAHLRRPGCILSTILVPLLLLTGCWKATIAVDGEPVAVVEVAQLDADPSTYDVRLTNMSGKKAKLTLIVYSVGVGGKWTKIGGTSAETTGSTKTLKATPYKGECIAVQASIRFGKAKAHELEELFEQACWKSPLDA